MTDETAPETPMMVPSHGRGLLKRGGKHPNSGRPASAIRRRLRGDFAQRLDTLRGIADGTVDVTLRHSCEWCGKEPLERSDRQWLDDVLKRVRTAVGEQLKALDLMAKYGMGTVKTITDDEVHERLLAQLDIIRNSNHVVNAEALINEIEAAWLRKPTT